MLIIFLKISTSLKYVKPIFLNISNNIYNITLLLNTYQLPLFVLVVDLLLH